MKFGARGGVLRCWALLVAVGLLGTTSAAGEAIDLYVDPATGQVFVSPGEGRTKLGTFQRVDEPAPEKSPESADAEPSPGEVPAPVVAAPPAAAPAPVVAVPPAGAAPPPAAADAGDPAIFAAVGSVLKGKWYERLTLRGYTQFRYHALIEKDGPGEWFAPADRSVAEDTTFLIRRGRLILSGDVTDRLYVYVQPDMMASPGDGDFSLQMRDLYADVAIDQDKEFRVRVGQSKVPFGFVNLQSSQNRIALERPDSLNSAVEGERDIGAYLFWAPVELRDRFRDLVRRGLKGSGDYGVLAVGVYSGQGLNRLDLNDNVHWIARLTYPFLLPGGQLIEPGVQGYWGKFVPRLREIPVSGDETITPDSPKNGVDDWRVGLSFVVYPQPFGVEAEWNLGDGPTLERDYSVIRSKFLHGGYLQSSYKLEFDYGDLFPMVRWQYYDGGRKFARNAPRVRTNEIDMGFEWAPIPEVELATIYTYSFFRTDSSDAPYEEFEDASRVGMQLQWNY